MKNNRILIDRRELEQKANKISELTNTNVRVSTVKGNINIEMANKSDKTLQNKKVFIGDINECYLFMEGILSFVELTTAKQER